MKRFFGLLLSTILIISVNGQSTFRGVVRDSDSKEPLTGATAILKGSATGATADASGIVVISNIPSGKQIIVFSFIGYESLQAEFLFPQPSEKTAEIFLEAGHEELGEVIISSTRGSRTIENVPTRIEFIAGEELEEKGIMKPGDIRMMLNESTGIQTQQTSATSFNSSIRIQGLDGKYTQILRDGFPLYSGFSGGLSLLQIVPLDLKQVEVIKGASSTLYGGGAIAGLINLISKVPEEEREITFMLNGTSATGMDASGFYSQKFKKTGATVFGSYNSGRAYDPANTGLTAIPQFNRYTFNPRLFFYFKDKTRMNIGLNNTFEDRTGGDMEYIRGRGDSIHSFFERNITNRTSTQFGIDRIINEKSGLSLKNSEGFYKRSIEIPGYRFSGKQISSFSEASYYNKHDGSEWIAGLNLWTDKFSQGSIDTVRSVNYNSIIYGAFLQNTLNVSEIVTFETGMRTDYQDEYGIFFLPRISALFRLNKKLSSRLGGGLGYKTPTFFTEEAERIQFRNILPLDEAQMNSERSAGGNFDINFKTDFSQKVFLSMNTMFFYTRVNDPLILTLTDNMEYEFQQPEGFIDTKGLETNIKLVYGGFKLFIGYTFADVNEHYNMSVRTFPLVAKHRFNNVLMYEIENKLKIGLEAYYFSRQRLNDDSTGRSYWINGLMIEKIWKRFSLFLNFENFLDTRQTRFDTIHTGTITYPVFRDIYAPVDGFVINGGMKMRF